MGISYFGAVTGLRIFVSSTFKDLREHRQAVLDSIHSLGSFTEDMVYWPADERDVRERSVDRVRQCDLLIPGSGAFRAGILIAVLD
jgi:hypothetical protein